MDEPLSNLDAKLRVQMRAEIHQLQRRARRDDDLRHPRPGRGDDDGRPRRGDERRPPAAGRHAAGALRQPAQRVRRRLHRLALDQPRRGRARARRTAACRSRFGDHRLPSTTNARREPHSGLADYVGRTVILGIRPEDFEDAALEPDAPADRRLKATCDLTEPLGSEVLVHFTIGGDRRRLRAPRRRTRRGRGRPFADDRGRGKTRLVARVSPRTRIAEGSEIELAVDTSRLYFFDPETRRRSSLALDRAGGQAGEDPLCRTSVSDDQRQRDDHRRGHDLAPGLLERVARLPDVKLT